MKLFTSLALIAVLSLFGQPVKGAFDGSLPPPEPLPGPEPEPVVLEATMLVKSLDAEEPVKICVKSRGFVPVILLVADKIDNEMVGDAKLGSDLSSDAVAPRYTKIYDVNRDGILDYIYFFRTCELFEDATKSSEVTLTLTVNYMNQPVEFTKRVQSIVPKQDMGPFKHR